MASQACHAGGGVATDAMVSDCHDVDEGASDEVARSCPGTDVVPDLGKLPTVAPLLTGHDFAPSASQNSVVVGPVGPTACPRDRPDLDDLCRLLI